MYNLGFREATIVLYSYLKNMKKTADALNIGVATVWRWLRNGIHPVKRTKVALSETLLAFVNLKMKEKNHMTQKEMKELIYSSFDVCVSRQCVATMFNVLGLTRKRLRKRGWIDKTKQVQRLEEFANKLDFVRSNNKNIVSIDEIGFDQRMTPVYGYSLKGTKAINFTHPTNRKRINVIMAIDDYGKKFYKLFVGPVSRTEFSTFIKDMPWPSETSLIMDNVSFHKTEVVRKTVQIFVYTTLHT